MPVKRGRPSASSKEAVGFAPAVPPPLLRPAAPAPGPSSLPTLPPGRAGLRRERLSEPTPPPLLPSARAKPLITPPPPSPERTQKRDVRGRNEAARGARGGGRCARQRGGGGRGARARRRAAQAASKARRRLRASTATGRAPCSRRSDSSSAAAIAKRPGGREGKVAVPALFGFSSLRPAGGGAASGPLFETHGPSRACA